MLRGCFMKFPKAFTHAPGLSICIMLALFAGCPGPLFGDTLANTHSERTAAVHTLIAVGDIMLSGSATPLLQAKGYDYPFKDNNLGKIVTLADVAFGNLEYPITMGGNRYKDKEYTFRGMPESLRAVKRAGFDLLSLANNHIMDYGEKGLKDTIRQCQNKQARLCRGRDRPDISSQVGRSQEAWGALWPPGLFPYVSRGILGNVRKAGDRSPRLGTDGTGYQGCKA